MSEQAQGKRSTQDWVCDAVVCASVPGGHHAPVPRAKSSAMSSCAHVPGGTQQPTQPLSPTLTSASAPPVLRQSGSQHDHGVGSRVGWGGQSPPCPTPNRPAGTWGPQALHDTWHAASPYERSCMCAHSVPCMREAQRLALRLLALLSPAHPALLTVCSCQLGSSRGATARETANR